MNKLIQIIAALAPSFTSSSGQEVKTEQLPWNSLTGVQPVPLKLTFGDEHFRPTPPTPEVPIQVMGDYHFAVTVHAPAPLTEGGRTLTSNERWERAQSAAREMVDNGQIHIPEEELTLNVSDTDAEEARTLLSGTHQPLIPTFTPSPTPTSSAEPTLPVLVIGDYHFAVTVPGSAPLTDEGRVLSLEERLDYAESSARDMVENGLFRIDPSELTLNVTGTDHAGGEDNSGSEDGNEDGDDSEEGVCEECGEAYGPDPDGSEGVIVHMTEDGEVNYDLDRDHVPVREQR